MCTGAKLNMVLLSTDWMEVILFKFISVRRKTCAFNFFNIVDEDNEVILNFPLCMFIIFALVWLLLKLHKIYKFDIIFTPS